MWLVALSASSNKYRSEKVKICFSSCKREKKKAWLEMRLGSVD